MCDVDSYLGLNKTKMYVHPKVFKIPEYFQRMPTR